VKELPRGLSPGPTCVPEARALSARLARLSLPYLSPDRGKSRGSPSTSVESFLTVRALGFPREFCFGVRRRGVVVSGLGTVRISVGTLSQGSRHSVVCKLTAHGVLSRGLIIRAVLDGPACGANP